MPNPEEQRDAIAKRLKSLGVSDTYNARLESTSRYKSTARRTPNAAWVTAFSPWVKPGDVVLYNGERWAVIETEPDDYPPDGLPVYGYCLAENPERIVKWFGLSQQDAYTVAEVWDQDAEAERPWTPERGELVRVLEAHDGARPEWRSFIEGRVVRYVGPSDSVNTTHSVNILDEGVAAWREVGVESNPGAERGVKKVGPYHPDIRIGDLVKVTDVLEAASPHFRKFMVGRIVEYRGVGRSDGEPEPLPMVRLQPGETWEPGLYLNQDATVCVAKVELHEARPETRGDHDPEWESIITEVLADVHDLACDQDWCGEYERQMRETFGIETPDREEEPSEEDWDVTVTLKGRVDPDEHIDLETVFGSPCSEDGNISTSEYVHVEHKVTVTITMVGEPGDDDINERLSDIGYTFDDFEVDSIREA